MSITSNFTLLCFMSKYPTYGEYAISLSSLVMCDGVPKLLNNVFLEADSSLHGIQAHCLGTCIQLVLNYEKHYLHLDRANDELLHVVCLHIQVFRGGFLP